MLFVVQDVYIKDVDNLLIYLMVKICMIFGCSMIELLI